MKPITKDLVSQWKSAREVSIDLENQIIDRIAEVLDTIFDCYEIKKHNWYFENAEEGGIGHLPPNFLEYNSTYYLVVIYSVPKNKHQMIVRFEENQQWDLSSGRFPTRWLFEDFEQELISSKARYETSLIDKHKKEIAKKTLQADLVKSAKAKLSKEELIALKKSL